MDKFKEGEDSFCTKDGRAQNRIPNELSEIVVQNGTIINAKMLNAWTEEIVNLIESLGLTPDSTKNNQIATGLNNTTVYNKVGTVNSWLCSKEKIPKTEAVLDGSVLRYSDYEDGLAVLKKRCPSWVSGENIQLPNYNNYFPRFDSSRTLGGTQGDAMQKITLKVESELTSSSSSRITMPGEISWKAYTGKSHSGYRTIHNLGGAEGAGHSARTALLLRKTVGDEVSSNFGLEFTKNVDQEGTIASEFRPQNFGVIMTVVVGIPK